MSEYISLHKLQQQALPAGILVPNNPRGHDGNDALVTLIYSLTVMRVRVQRSHCSTLQRMHHVVAAFQQAAQGPVSGSHGTCRQHIQATCLCCPCTAEPATPFSS